MTSSAHDSIPIIDVDGLRNPNSSAAIQGIADDVAKACRDTGFFYIINHGIGLDLIDSVLEANREFHARPEKDKLPLKLNAWHRGYQPLASTRMASSAKFAPASIPNQLESFLVRDEIGDQDPRFKKEPFCGPNQWPDDPTFRQQVESYYAAVRDLAYSMLPVFSLAVGKGANFLHRFFDPATTTLRLVHYPPRPSGEASDYVGIFPHTDYGFFTMLVQDDVGGLEIQRVDGTWVDAPYIEGAFIVNIGDITARWTHDLFTSSPHRVLNKSTTRDRYSVAFFFDPDFESIIEGIEEMAHLPGAKKYDPIRYVDYYRERMDNNHPDRVAAY